jgi:hypothetical protein
MATDLISRPSLARAEEVVERRPRRVWTSAQWLDYFQRNAANRRPIPWDQGASASEEELAAVGRSLQAWQLGESSDGNHLRAAAARYADVSGDWRFPEVAELFIREEQGHSEMMGRFLDLAGLGRVRRDWGDRAFRALRHWRCDLESWTTPVIVAEVLALVYFDALRRATASAVLRAICTQILADEVAHIRFQTERFAMLFRGRAPLRRRLALGGQKVLFLGTALAVWSGHRKALRAGGYGWRRFWQSAWHHMNQAWARMDPDRYEW